MKPNQILVPDAESFLAGVSASQAKGKLHEATLFARANIGSCGHWRRLPHAFGLFALALLLLATAAFAPPGVWASTGAMLAVASLLAAIYFALEFDHSMPRQTVSHFGQVADKAAAKTGAEESDRLADAQITRIKGAMNQQANEMLAVGHSLDEIKEYYAATLTGVRAIQQAIQARGTNASRGAETAEREVRETSGVFETRARRWWPSRFLPAYTRTAALRWLAALEQSAATKMNQAACAAAIQACEQLAERVGQLAGDYSVASTQTTSAATDALIQIVSARQLQNITGCNKGLPLPDEITHLVEQQVADDESSIRHSIASRPPEQSVSEAIREQAENVVARVRLPKTFAEFYSQRNGDKQSLLQQIDLQSHEFATASSTPGRPRIRHRFLLADGGETAQVCKDVTAISKDLIVRTSDHPRADEFVCVTESRFEPCSEITEYLEGVRQFQGLPIEKRALMIVAVEDDDFLNAYSPESTNDPSRPSRLLCVALVLGLIKRTGAECYKIVDENDPDNAHFAKGFDQAIDVMATDGPLARQVEQAIEKMYSVEGGEAIRKKLLDAKTKNLVPSVAGKRFREVLSEEIKRQSSVRTSVGA